MNKSPGSSLDTSPGRASRRPAGGVSAGGPKSPTGSPTGSGTGGAQLCGDIDIRIARDGTWFYHGSPITRNSLVKLFASALRRDADGTFWIETPAEKCRVRVDDAPFLAVEMTVSGSGRKQRLSFRTNGDEIVTAGPDHPLRVAIDRASGAPAPHIYVRDGLEALIARSVYYDLVALGVEETGAAGTRFGVWSDGVFFPLDGTGADGDTA